VSYIWNDIFVVIVKRTGFILDHWIIFYVKYLCFAKRAVFVLDHYIGLFSPSSVPREHDSQKLMGA
jgi:hypothetical protein